MPPQPGNQFTPNDHDGVGGLPRDDTSPQPTPPSAGSPLGGTPDVSRPTSLPPQPPGTSAVSNDSTIDANPVVPQPQPGSISANGAIVISPYSGKAQGLSPFTGPTGGGKKVRIKMFAIIVGVVLLLGGGGVAFYFGYYANPTMLWKQSLSNTNKGYDLLVNYVDRQSKSAYKGFKMDGSFAAKADGFNFDGSFTAQGDKNNTTQSATLNLGIAQLGLEARSIKAENALQPDVYLQVSGLKKLNATLDTNFGPQIDKLDNQWVVVDHNLLATLSDQATQRQSAKSLTKLTEADIHEFLQKIGTVNEQYVFTTDKDKSVTKIIKKLGKETVDERKTYRYKIGFVKENVKTYAEALCNTARQTKLGKYFTDTIGTGITETDCKNAAKDANNIKDSDTIDVWVAMDTRLPYKVRMSDPKNAAQQYVDIGLKYKSGDSYPFFFTYYSKEGGAITTVSATTTLDSKANKLTVDMKGDTSGTSPASFTAKMTMQPTNDAVKITAPEGAKPIMEVLQEFGVDKYLEQDFSDESLGPLSVGLPT